MNEPAQTCIHLGLPKTATTSIRFNLFAKHSQIHYLGKFLGGELPPAIRAAILERWTLKEKYFGIGDVRKQGIPEQLVYASKQNLIPVLSMESLAGGPLWKKKLQARRFKQFFGDCKIILFARKPVSFLGSFYAQMLRNFQERSSQHGARWTRTLGEAPHYFDPNEWLQATWKTIGSPKNFIRYADTATAYARVFGRENVDVLLFEELVRSPESFIEKLCAHIGIDPEEGYHLIEDKRSNKRLTTDYTDRIHEIEQSNELTAQFRAASPKERREMLHSEKQIGKRITPQFSEHWLKKINAIGDNQNRILAKKWGLPMSDYGYRI